MKRFLSFCLVAVALLSIVGCAKDEVETTGTITGFISDFSHPGEAVQGATVVLSKSGATRTTGADGRFEFNDVEPGTYTISVSAHNYKSQSKQVTVTAGQTANCDVQLAPSAVSESVEISPVNLVFGKGVEQLAISITNNGSSDLQYTVSNAPDYVEISPVSGTVAARSKQAITVHIKERSSITSDRSGQFTINYGNNSQIVSLSVTNSIQSDPEKDEEDDNTGGDPEGNVTASSVTRGLLAYYTFNDGASAKNDHDPGVYDGNFTGSPEFVDGVGNGKYGLRLKKGTYINVPQHMLEGKSVYSMAMWIKEFGQGYILTSLQGNNITCPSFRINDNDKVHFCYSQSGGYSFNWSSTVFNTSMINYQTGGWHFVAITMGSDGNAILYIDGVKVDSQPVNPSKVSAVSMAIGSPSDSDEFYVDNVRIHGVLLSPDEIKTIYNAEK